MNNHTNENEARELSCPFCAKPESKLLFKINIEGDNFSLARCKSCRLIHSVNAKSINETYSLNNKNYEKLSFFKRFMHKRLLKLRINFITNIMTPGYIFEAQCGKGETLALLKDRGFNILGIEVNHDKANREHDLIDEIYKFDFQKFFHYENEFDAIIFNDYLRYSPNPDKDIEKAISLLKDDGYFFIEEKITGSKFDSLFGKYCNLYDVPESVYFYNPQILKKILRKHSFVLKKSVKINSAGYFDVFKSLKRFLKDKLKLKNIFLQLPFLIPLFFLSPLINLIFFSFNYFRFGIFGNRFTGVFSRSKYS